MAPNYTVYAPEQPPNSPPRVTKYIIQDDGDRRYLASLCHGLNAEWVEDQLPDKSQIYIVPSPFGLAVRAFAKMVRYSPDEAELKVLCTPDHARGKGHAKLLMSTMEDLARRKEYRTLRIESVEDAVTFYKGIGYSVISVDEDSGLVIMRKDLSPPSAGRRKTRRRYAPNTRRVRRRVA